MTNSLSEYKIKASILLKYLRSDDSERAEKAASRFKRLPHLAAASLADIIKQKESIQRKHALTVIALEQNYETWSALKHDLDSQLPPVNLYPGRCGGFLNNWYADYDRAKTALEEHGGYLMPYKKQFFICQDDYVIALGLEPDDPDWQRIAFDWAKPDDKEAWLRLYGKLHTFEQALVL